MSQLVIMCGFMQAQKESHQKANSRSLNKLDYLICYKAKQSQHKWTLSHSEDRCEKQRWGLLSNDKLKIELFYVLYHILWVFIMLVILEGLIPSFVQTGDCPICRSSSPNKMYIFNIH